MISVKNEHILEALDEELDRLRKIRNLLAGAPIDANWNGHPRAKKRFLSEEARQRIVDAQKRRWAAQKAGA
jgi:hypothetical protein